MAAYNKIMLLGNLTRDPQLSYLQSNKAVVDFGIAVNRTWVGQDGQKKEDVMFIDCTAYGKTAENINKYMKKGSSVFIEGRVDLKTWTGKDGTKRSKHIVSVQLVQFVGGGGHVQNKGQGQSQSQDYDQDSQSNSYGDPRQGHAPLGGDEIPF